MRTYKSPIQQKPINIQKKSSINFIKNVAAPKQYKSSNIHQPYLHQNQLKYFQTSQIQTYQQQQQNRVTQSQHLILIIKQQLTLQNKPIKSQKSNTSPLNIIKAYFPYRSQTTIRNLISFVHQQIKDNLVYVKSENIYIDYILGLKEFRVKQLVEYLDKERQQDGRAIELQLICCEYAEIHSNNYLKNFQLIKCVGSGGFSKVYLVRGYGKLMAMKVINKEYIIENQKENIINNEKNILTLCSDHPFITKLETSFQSKNFLIFVMEFCNGGQLFNLLRKVRRMSQDNAKFYFVETLAAIAHIHKKGIIYRDIKPENIILDYEGHVRLADYGLSKIMQDTRQSKTYSFCGSAEYMAPQMLLKKGHSFDIDFYCLGALLYELVIGLPPYYSRNQNELFSNIIHSELQFPEHVQLSEELKDFLQKLLQKQTENRYKTLQQILSHSWMKNIRMEEVVGKKLKPPYKTDMFEYNFDDNDFARQQQQSTQKLLDEQEYSSFDDMRFPDFFYESKEISDLKTVIRQQKQKGLFIRSSNNNIGQFYAQPYHKRQPSNASLNSNQQKIISKSPSINILSNCSSQIMIPSSVEVSKREIVKNPIFNKYEESSNISLANVQGQKVGLYGVRSVGKITSKQFINKSTKSINSSTKKPINPGLNTIYTQKLTFHHLGNNNKPQSPSYLSSLHPTKSFSYIRQPTNYFSIQKPHSKDNRNGHAILDIHNLKVKNTRNYSLQVKNEIYSNNVNRSQTIVYPSYTQGIRPNISPYQHQKGYLQNFKERLIPSKVKKTSYKNGEKFSISMLNNVHYRN